jgi:hypothetical protein
MEILGARSVYLLEQVRPSLTVGFYHVLLSQCVGPAKVSGQQRRNPRKR